MACLSLHWQACLHRHGFMGGYAELGRHTEVQVASSHCRNILHGSCCGLDTFCNMCAKGGKMSSMSDLLYEAVIGAVCFIVFLVGMYNAAGE